MSAHTIATQRTRWASVIGVGLTLTLLIALTAAAAASEGSRLVTFIVFAATTAPVAFGGAWALIPDPDAADPVVHIEETVEHEWAQSAASGSFTDLITAMGLALVVQSVLDTASIPHLVFLVLGMGDFAVRYAVLRRRAA